MDTTKTTTHLGLCAGYGGIEIGLKRAIPTLRTIALCEIEGFAVANLVAKMEAGLMDPAPIWTDLKTFPWAEFRDRVDILTGGYPCQPFSAAGKRLGTEDPRHLWPFIADGIRILRPKLCFFENVEGHISLGLREVIGELESIGYQTAWGIFSASEVGAPHQRKRVFILAYDQRQRIEELGRQIAVGSQQHPARDHGDNAWPSRPGELGDADGVGSLDEQQSAQGRRTTTTTQSSGTAWPSRPGEQQFAWEPPRVVGTVAAKLANFCSRDSQSGGDTAQASGESVGAWREGADPNAHGGSSFCGGDQGDEQAGMAHAHSCGGEEPEHQHTNLPTEPSGGNAEAMGNATSQRPRTLGAEPAGQQRQTSFASTGDAMGNAEQLLLPATGEHGTMDEASGIPTDGEGSESAQTDPESSAARKREVSGSNASECSETQPPLGRNPNGPAGGLGYAELCISCDNRTDELRLLGNGVAPATAERAFRILWEELLK